MRAGSGFFELTFRSILQCAINKCIFESGFLGFKDIAEADFDSHQVGDTNLELFSDKKVTRDRVGR